MRVALGVLLCAVVIGCEEEQPPPPPPPPPPPLPPLAGPRPIATPVAFDLAATGDGAVLVWGSPSRLGGGLRVAVMDSLGGIVGEERGLVRRGRAAGGSAEQIPADAIEISIAAGGGRLGVAWILRDQTVLDVQAVLGDTAGAAFSPPIELGRTELTVTGRRGHVEVAAGGDGTIAVFHQGRRGSCEPGAAPEPDPAGQPSPDDDVAAVDEGPADDETPVAEPGPCMQFRVRRIGVGPTVRDGVPLIVPEPCAEPIAGYAHADGTWYYGVCARQEGIDATVLYGIQFDPQYAASVNVLQGAVPRGFVPLPDGVVAVGTRGAERLAVEVREATRRRVDLGAVRSEVPCVDGRPVVRAIGASSTLEIPLDGPRNRLEALLPDDIAPPRSRAAFTGDALLVAIPIGNEVSIHRFQCDGGALVRTNRI